MKQKYTDFLYKNYEIVPCVEKFGENLAITLKITTLKKINLNQLKKN